MKIKINAVRKYLASNGWSKEIFSEHLEKVKKVFGNKEMTFFVPISENIEDYDWRMLRFIETLSILEKRNKAEVLEDISNIGIEELEKENAELKAEVKRFKLSTEEYDKNIDEMERFIKEKIPKEEIDKWARELTEQSI